MEILRTENLPKVYDGKHKVPALGQVNLSAEIQKIAEGNLTYLNHWKGKP